MRLKAALSGNLEQYMADELRTVETAVTAGIREGGNDTKSALRRDVVQGGLGARLSKSWRVKFYPRSGKSIEAAAFVFTKAATLVSAFDQGATIRSKDGMFLAIPTDAAPKRGTDRKRISPSNFPEHRLGKLRFVYRRTGPSLLVLDNAKFTKTGRVRQNVVRRKTGAYSPLKGRSTVPMFLLYPRVRLKRRLNVSRVMKRQESRVPRLIDSHFKKLDAHRKQ